MYVRLTEKKVLAFIHKIVYNRMKATNPTKIGMFSTCLYHEVGDFAL